MTARPADLVLTGGKVITLDRRSRIADSVAVTGDRLSAVGSRAEVEACVAPSTRRIDLAGRAVLPGFVDAHAHMDREGLKGVFPSLGPVRSIADIQDRIADLARATPPGEWIVTMPIGEPPSYFGVPGNLAENRWPTRQELDVAAPRHPVFIRSIWGFWRHTLPLVACANTMALVRAGVTRDTASPIATLEIGRDRRGDPTGIFVEHDFQPVAELILFRQAPGFTRRERAATLPEAARAYHAFGTTSVFEGHGVATELLRAYKDARRAGTLTMRAALALSPNWKTAGEVDLAAFVEAWMGWLGEPALGDDGLKVGGLFVDLDLSDANELRGRASPYTGWAGFNYDTGLPREKVLQVLRACVAHDIRPVAIWPNMLDLYDEIDRETPLKGRRWVLGHVSTLAPRDVERIARMGLVVSTHTNRYVYKEGHLLRRRLGPGREEEISPLRSLLEAGVTVCLATDNVPVSMFSPVWQSVSRKSLYDANPIAPGQALTREQALRCATEAGASLTFDEDRKGSLETGKLADLFVASEDPLTVPEDGLQHISSRLTIVGGSVVHEGEDEPGLFPEGRAGRARGAARHRPEG